MKTNLLSTLSALALLGLAGSPAVAQQPARDFFAPTPREVENYSDKKKQLESLVEFYRGKYNFASKQYAAAVKSGNAAESDQWNSEVTNWDNAIKKTQADIAELNTTPEGRAARPVANVALASPITITAPGGAVRPMDDTLPRLQQREAEAELAKLGEFRAAEGSTARKGPKLEADPAAKTNLRAAQAELARIDEATASANNSARVGSANPGQLQMDLVQLNNRKAALEKEVERWSREQSDWEARYKELQANLARLESENKAKTQLETARTELSKIESDIQQAQARLQIAQAAQTAEAARQAELFRQDELTIGRRLPTGAGTGEVGVVGRKRATGAVQAQRDFEILSDKKTRLQREVDVLQGSYNRANSEYSSAVKLGNQADIDRLSKDIGTLDGKLKAAQSDLAALEDEAQTKMRAMQKTVLEVTPNTPITDGDALSVTVLEDETLGGFYTVRRGAIIMPRVGRVNLNGMDIPTAEKSIKDTLEATQLRQATVTVDRQRPEDPKLIEIDDPKILPGGTPAPEQEKPQDVIFLAGEFVNAGPIRLPAGEQPTLVKTILRSGGVTPSADLTRVKLIHFEKGGRGNTEEINVQGILNGVGTPTDWPLSNLDIVVLPAYAPVVYVTGNVQKPGTLRLFQDEAMTAYSAILRSGGFSRFANLKKSYVVRDLGNGEKVNIPVNIKDVQAGKVPDIILQGRDIIVVPESFWSF